MLKISGVLDRRRGDADDLATDGDQVERLFHALGGIHRVARQHRLHHDRILTPMTLRRALDPRTTTSRVLRR